MTLRVSIITDLIGKTLVSFDGEIGEEELYLTTECGKKYKMHHYQECCESVEIDDIVGDIDDLIGSPITVAEERVEAGDDSGNIGTSTWTFYTLATRKGYVTIKWYGCSNGCYSEDVSIDLIK